MSIPKWKKQVKFLESYKEIFPDIKDEIKRVERRQENHRKKKQNEDTRKSKT